MAVHTARPLVPVPRNTLLSSIIIPAYNEAENVTSVVEQFATQLRTEQIPFELVVVNDNSTDDTAAVVAGMKPDYPELLVVHNRPPGGLGRAIRCGLQHYKGDAVAIIMADLSDSPEDAVVCYRKLEEGYDCAFGSRFMKGSSVAHYPPLKLVIQRVVNNLIRVMFMTRHNDMTNAFKAYRRYVIDAITPLNAAHFTITIEMSLSALIRRFRIAQFPISWSGRTWGSSKLKLRAMGRRYLATLLKIWFERLLILDDLLQDSEANDSETAASPGTALDNPKPDE